MNEVLLFSNLTFPLATTNVCNTIANTDHHEGGTVFIYFSIAKQPIREGRNYNIIK